MTTKQPAAAAAAEEIKEVKESVRPGRNKKIKELFKTGDRTPKTKAKKKQGGGCVCQSQCEVWSVYGHYPFAPFAPFLILSMWPLFSHVWREVEMVARYRGSSTPFLLHVYFVGWLVDFTCLVLHPKFRHPPTLSVVPKGSKKSVINHVFFCTCRSYCPMPDRPDGRCVVDVSSWI